MYRCDVRPEAVPMMNDIDAPSAIYVLIVA